MEGPIPTTDLVVVTAGRREYLTSALASAQNHLSIEPGRWYFFDDSGDPEFAEWLRDGYPEAHVFSSPTRMGFTETMKRVWATLACSLGAPYVFHLEEDFVLDRDVPLGPMQALLEIHPGLAQVILMREGIARRRPELLRQVQRYGEHVSWMEHRLFYSCNPGLHRRSLCSEGWPDGPASEVQMGKYLVDRGQRFAVWGKGESWTTHIGKVRAGVGGY